jgi:hypothetical protein
MGTTTTGQAEFAHPVSGRAPSVPRVRTRRTSATERSTATGGAGSAGLRRPNRRRPYW